SRPQVSRRLRVNEKAYYACVRWHFDVAIRLSWAAPCTRRHVRPLQPCWLLPSGQTACDRAHVPTDYTNGVPVISDGISIPINFSTVGATSPNFPSAIAVY